MSDDTQPQTMSEDEVLVYDHLLLKFSSLLHDEGADSISCRKQLRSIETFLKSNFISTTKDPQQLLLQLIDHLKDCRFYAHRRRLPKKGKLVLFNSLKELIFTIRTKFRLTALLADFKKGAISRLRLRNEQRYFRGNHAAELWDRVVRVGLDSPPDELEKVLVDDLGERLMGIGVVGLQKSGKTSIVKDVFERSKVGTMYFPKVWVDLSENIGGDVGFDLRKKILKQILKEVGGDKGSELANDKLSVTDLLDRLHIQLMFKKYLIVIDCLWQSSDWLLGLTCKVPEELAFGSKLADRLWYYLPKTSGGRIVVTTTRECVARDVVGGGHLFRVEAELNKKKCLSAFKEAAAGRGTDGIGEDQQDEILEMCLGIPDAAKIMAKIIP